MLIVPAGVLTDMRLVV